MKQSGSRRRNSSWLKPLLVIAVATLFTAACKESAVQGSSGSSAPPGGSPGAPPSGGMPSPGGGMPSPGGGMPSPGGGMPPPGGSSGGSPGSGPPSPSGGSSEGGASGGSSGGAGDVGAIPPPPGQGGGGGGMEGESGGGAEGGGDSGGGGTENPFGDADSSDGVSECGDTGALPGGIGGMGREGECLSSEQPSASESDSESDSESESSSSAAESGGGGGGGGGGSSGAATTGTGGAGSVGEFPAESSAERAERLGRELDESIGGFDETLGEEQREIAAAGRVIEGYDVAGGEGQGSGGLISLGGQTASTESRSGSVGGGRTPASEPLAGLTQQDIEELTPDDIPTMVDDDIIARQLREAAIVEKNSDLRDRLWDEYRKYKGISVSD